MITIGVFCKRSLQDRFAASGKAKAKDNLSIAKGLTDFDGCIVFVLLVSAMVICIVHKRVCLILLFWARDTLGTMIMIGVVCNRFL